MGHFPVAVVGKFWATFLGQFWVTLVGQFWVSFGCQLWVTFVGQFWVRFMGHFRVAVVGKFWATFLGQFWATFGGQFWVKFVGHFLKFFKPNPLIGGHSKSKFVEEGRGGDHWKANKSKQGEEGSQHMCTFAFFKKMLRFSKWSFIVILQFFLLIIMGVWNTIMKDYNIQSCQWMACDHFRQPFLLCTIFRSFLCTVHYFLCAFSEKMATYSLVIDNVYFMISSLVY